MLKGHHVAFAECDEGGSLWIWDNMPKIKTQCVWVNIQEPTGLLHAITHLKSLICSQHRKKRPKSICQLAWSPETQRGTIGQWWIRSWVVEDKVSTEIVASPSTFEWGPWKKTWERDAFLPLLEGRNGLMAQGHMEGEVKAKTTSRRPETEE